MRSRPRPWQAAEAALSIAPCCTACVLAHLSGFIQPCLPSAAAMPPAGPNWIHEIKHDGFRIIKMKNPSAPAVKREAEEDWSKEKWR